MWGAHASFVEDIIVIPSEQPPFCHFSQIAASIDVQWCGLASIEVARRWLHTDCLVNHPLPFLLLLFLVMDCLAAFGLVFWCGSGFVFCLLAFGLVFVCPLAFGSFEWSFIQPKRGAWRRGVKRTSTGLAIMLVIPRVSPTSLNLTKLQEVRGLEHVNFHQSKEEVLNLPFSLSPTA